MKEKVSVIVPIYNVEKFLEKCIDSILTQTYQNIEILLVDDGSSDRSGVMCDSYAKKDSRIKVAHKKNGGLSDARNAGLDIATGDLIAFVDSDDWVEPEYIQVLYDSMKKTGSDISICSFYRVKGENRRLYQVQNQKEAYESKEALKLLLLEKRCPNYVWNKLYKKKIFASLRFPKGKIWEDIYIMGDAFYSADKISFTNVPLYNYVWRGNSIIGSADVKEFIEFFKVMLYRYNRFKSDLNLLPYLQYDLIAGYRLELYHCKLKILNQDSYGVIMEHRMLMKQIIDRKKVYPLLTWKQKIMFELGSRMPKTAIVIYGYRQKKNRLKKL